MVKVFSFKLTNVIGVTLLVVCLYIGMSNWFNRLWSVHIYSGSNTRGRSNDDISLHSNSYKSSYHEATNITRTPFIYSEDILFETILEIRRRNCQHAYGANASVCQKTDDCNKIRNEDDIHTIPGCKRRLPGCIIIGVWKGGTREVIDFLMMNPNLAIRKYPFYEIGFFSRADRWTKGLKWYKTEMPHSMPGQVTLEKSPRYYSDPDTPERISRSIPGVKLILIVRDPVDRTISHVSFKNPGRNLTYLLGRMKMDPGRERFIKQSIYDEYFKQYLKYFNRSSIHVVDGNQFKNDPFTVLRGIEKFIGFPHLIIEEDLVFNSQTGFFCLRNERLGSHVCFGEDRGRKQNVDNLEVYKNQLRRIFKSHNERFFDLVGKRFAWT